MNDTWYKKLINALLPVFYLTVWFVFILICGNFGFFEKLDVGLFLTLSFLVMFFGMVTKATCQVPNF